VSKIVDERTGAITDDGIRRAYKRFAEASDLSVDAGLLAESFLHLVLHFERAGQHQLVEACRGLARAPQPLA